MKKIDKGFTLIELLVVIIIIGILAAIAIPAFLNQRQKGFDAQVASDVRNAGTIMSGMSEPVSDLFPGATQALYVDNGSGLAPSNAKMLADQQGAPQITVTDGVLIEFVHSKAPLGQWNRPHRANEFCVTGRSLSSGKYDYPGGNVALYYQQAYFDTNLGGLVPFKAIVDDYNGPRQGACYAYAKRFIDAGGTI